MIQAIPPGTDLEYLIEIADVEYPFPYPNAFTIDTAGKLSISKSTSSKEDDIPNSDMLSEVSVISFINLRKGNYIIIITLITIIIICYRERQ